MRGMTSAAPHTANWTGDVPARTGAFQDFLAVIFRFYPVSSNGELGSGKFLFLQ